MKKALKIVGAVLGALVLVLLVLTFYQFPYCLKNKETILKIVATIPRIIPTY
jgi:hypothetical protein